MQSGKIPAACLGMLASETMNGELKALGLCISPLLHSSTTIETSTALYCAQHCKPPPLSLPACCVSASDHTAVQHTPCVALVLRTIPLIHPCVCACAVQVVGLQAGTLSNQHTDCYGAGSNTHTCVGSQCCSNSTNGECAAESENGPARPVSCQDRQSWQPHRG